MIDHFFSVRLFWGKIFRGKLRPFVPMRETERGTERDVIDCVQFSYSRPLTPPPAPRASSALSFCIFVFLVVRYASVPKAVPRKAYYVVFVFSFPVFYTSNSVFFFLSFFLFDFFHCTFLLYFRALSLICLRRDGGPERGCHRRSNQRSDGQRQHPRQHDAAEQAPRHLRRAEGRGADKHDSAHLTVRRRDGHLHERGDDDRERGGELDAEPALVVDEGEFLSDGANDAVSRRVVCANNECKYAPCDCKR